MKFDLERLQRKYYREEVHCHSRNRLIASTPKQMHALSVVITCAIVTIAAAGVPLSFVYTIYGLQRKFSVC